MIIQVIMSFIRDYGLLTYLPVINQSASIKWPVKASSRQRYAKKNNPDFFDSVSQSEPELL